MGSKVDEGEVWFSRFNVSLARSQRLLQSWLPSSSASDAPPGADEEDDGLRDAMNEVGGLDSSAARGEDVADVILNRSRLSSNDRLLEQLLGKKAAQARKKSQQPRKGMSSAVHAAPRPVTAAQNARARDDNSEDEEGGRATTILSRRGKDDTQSSAPTKDEGDDTVQSDVDDAAHTETNDIGEDRIATRVGKESVPQSARRGPANSYLDEVLAMKARKGKRKRQGYGK